MSNVVVVGQVAYKINMMFGQRLKAFQDILKEVLLWREYDWLDPSYSSRLIGSSDSFIFRRSLLLEPRKAL